MSVISEYVAKHSTNPDALETLKVMHSCDIDAARSIIESGVLKATYCDVFKKNLLYFFYGKPNYPVSSNKTEYRTDIEYLPVCFVVPFDRIKLYKAFPFDTGAFAKGFYEKHLHENIKVESFELDNTLEGIKRYIEAFYGNNDDYLEGEAINTKEVERHLHGLDSIHHATGEQETDRRSNTVEVQLDYDVSILKEAEFVVLPDALLLDEAVVEQLKGTGLPCVLYHRYADLPPNMYHGIVYDKIFRRLYGEKVQEVVL